MSLSPKAPVQRQDRHGDMKGLNLAELGWKAWPLSKIRPVMQNSSKKVEFIYFAESDLAKTAAILRFGIVLRSL